MAWQFTNGIPVYIQIMDVISRRIIIGEYKPGEKLPSVRELAEEAQVNPNTMQKALSEMERDGLIFTQRTSGRFVTNDDTKITSLRDKQAETIVNEFLKKMKGLGMTRQEIIDKIKNGG